MAPTDDWASIATPATSSEDWGLTIEPAPSPADYFSVELDGFLADFGVRVTAGDVVTKGILDAPSEIIGGGMVVSTDYTLTYQTATLPGLGYQSPLTADGIGFVVREVRALDDGRFSIAAMSRI